MALKTENKRLEFVLKNLLAGGVAGMVSKTTVAPLDRIKILLQAHNKHHECHGVWSGLRHIIKTESPWAMYKGNGAQMVRIFPYAATQFTSFEVYKRYLEGVFGATSHVDKFIAGAGAGLTAVTLTYPLDTIRARLAFQKMNANDMLLIQQVVEDLEDAEAAVADPERELHILQQSNPFVKLSDDRFQKYFRVTKDLARDIIEMVTPYVQQGIRASALNVERQVLVALKFFGFGSYQEITGTNKYLSVSQASVSRSINNVTQALCLPQIFNRWVHFPRNIHELRQLRHRFFEKYQFPGIIGCIDCTHVAIVRPVNNDPQYPEHIYVNRKQYHSINVQLICDEKLNILNVNARFPGSSHDAHIWRQSTVSDALRRIYEHNPNDTFFLIGDSGYPLRPYLMTPFRNAEQGAEERYNDRFNTIRSLIERCNGVLKNRFRCLLKHRVLHYSPTTASKIINACVVLHNMCLAYNIPEPEYDAEMEHADLGMYNPNYHEEGNVGNDDLATARRLRQHIVTNHFN